jgi:hypothetical protein
VFYNAERSKKTKTKVTLSPKSLSICNSLDIEEEGARLVSKEIIFLEYITIEKIELSDINWNDKMCVQLCEAG